MSSRFDPFNERELALMSLGIAAASTFVADGSDDGDRRESAQTALDLIALMDEISLAEAWKDHPDQSQIRSAIDPELRKGLQEIVDGTRP
jgi:hypothetical protein